VAEILVDVVSSYKMELEILEESYVEIRYGELEYMEGQARTCLEDAEKILGGVEGY
jgi:HEPN domain-containing protein